MIHIQAKALIVNKDRRITSVILKPGQKSFRIGTIDTAQEYMVNSDCVVYGKRRNPKRFWLEWEDVTIYYYQENHPSPVPFPHPIHNKPAKGITSSELGQLFNERFYQMIARVGRNKREELILYVSIAGACVSAYAAWQLTRMGPLLRRLAEHFGVF